MKTDYTSLNNFDPNEKNLTSLSANFEYSANLPLAPMKGLKIEVKAGLNKQDLKNHFVDKNTDKASLNSMLEYTFNNGKKGSGTVYAKHNYVNYLDQPVTSTTPSETNSLTLGSTFKGNTARLANGFYDFNLKFEFTAKTGAQPIFSAFLIIRPR